MPDSTAAHTDSIPAYAPVPPAESYELPTGFTADSIVSTVLVDSIGRDTISGRIPHFIPVAEADSLRAKALMDSLGTHSALPEIPSGASEGLPPVAVTPSASTSTPLTALLMGTLVVTALNAAGVGSALKSYRHELWSVRRRPNVFDDEHAASIPMAVLLALVFVVFGGIVLYNVPGYPPSPSFYGASAFMALMAAWYGFRYVAYRLVAFAFAGRESGRRWINGFMATQAYSGLLMIAPAFLLLYRPGWHDTLITISLSVYSAANLLFIAKGFRIFYRNFQSLLYFILYLCTLEIIPMFAIYRLSVYLWALTS